jgi:hypothetical protein
VGAEGLELKSTAKIFLLISLLLVPVTFPGPALLINKLAGNLNLSRFGEYSFIFISIAGAVGITILFGKTKSKHCVFIVVLFFIMAFLTVSNDFTASDNPLIKRQFYTFYLSEEESVSLQRAAEIADGYVMADYISCRYLENTQYADKIHVLETDRQGREFLRSSSKDILIIRTAELAKRPLRLFTSPGGEFIFDPSLGNSLDYYDNDYPMWDTLERYNTIYDSGTVIQFQ